ncbi:hypothetical protein [Amorphus sp. 3PC139-8]|uniref:hypothetical protein n=1 Tax=Amorphus sp. 3PC139-8 TaxID=2735676 RepID=UPI00345D7216
MNRLNAIDTFAEQSWDEFVIEVEDALLIESGEELGPDHMHDIAAAYDAGLSPWSCVIAMLDSNPQLRQRAA